MRAAIFATVVGSGGIQTHTRALAEVLHDAGYEVLIISSVLEIATAGEPQATENDSLKRRGVRIVLAHSQRHLGGRIREFLRLSREVRRFTPDIYYVHGSTWHGSLIPLTLR